jgi:hypothetical protein
MLQQQYCLTEPAKAAWAAKAAFSFVAAVDDAVDARS